MPAHPLQKPLDYLPVYLTDARRLFAISKAWRSDASAARRAAGNATGGGRPTSEFKSLNRAVVVASVGAMEAFFEDLALVARDELASHNQVAKEWFPIQGSKGTIQTPSPGNLAKMMWVYFRYDPRPDWDVLVTTSWSEQSASATNWRGATARYKPTSSTSAVDALASMVKVRHGFAHQDESSKPPAVAGVVAHTKAGNLSLQSHHAFNSMSLVAQIAVQSTWGLSTHLGLPSAPRLKWRQGMTNADLESLLVDTPAAGIIGGNWNRSPF